MRAERRDGAVVRLVELVEDAPVGADRVADVVEPRLVDLAEARVELDELERRRPSPSRALEDLRELGPRLEREVDAIEVRERLGVERLDAEDVLVRLLGLRDVAELVLERLREALADRALHVGVGVQAEDVGVRVGERLPAAVDRAGEARRLLADFSSSGYSLSARM